MIHELEMYHYLILHFPIALFITGYIFDILGFFNKRSLFTQFGYWNLNMGIFWGLLSIVSGLITDQDIGHMDSILPIWSTHGTHMIVAVLMFLVISIIRKLNKNKKINVSSKLILLTHGLIVLFFIHGAHIGAKLADRV